MHTQSGGVVADPPTGCATVKSQLQRSHVQRKERRWAHPMHQNGTECFALVMGSAQLHPERLTSSQDAACICTLEVCEDIFNERVSALAAGSWKSMPRGYTNTVHCFLTSSGSSGLPPPFPIHILLSIISASQKKGKTILLHLSPPTRSEAVAGASRAKSSRALAEAAQGFAVKYRWQPDKECNCSRQLHSSTATWKRDYFQEQKVVKERNTAAFSTAAEQENPQQHGSCSTGREQKTHIVTGKNLPFAPLLLSGRSGHEDHRKHENVSRSIPEWITAFVLSMPSGPCKPKEAWPRLLPAVFSS